jgi:hypothetical protein
MEPLRPSSVLMVWEKAMVGQTIVNKELWRSPVKARLHEHLKLTLFVLAFNIIGFAEGYFLHELGLQWLVPIILATAFGAVLVSRRLKGASKSLSLICEHRKTSPLDPLQSLIISSDRDLLCRSVRRQPLAGGKKYASH